MLPPAALLPLAAWLAVETGAAPAASVVVTAAAPVDAQRLADAMRTYLDEYGISIETGGAAAAGDLRHQLADARRIGESVRALAVVRAETGARGTIEIELVDLTTEKALIAEVPRPARDEDLYRALALKIQALLRSTLSEAPERLAAESAAARLVATASAAMPSPAAPPARFGMETGYALLSFPLGPQAALQGLSLVGSFAPRPWLELTLGFAALGSARVQARDVVAVATVFPVFASARLRYARARLEGLIGPSAEVAYVGVAPSSTTTQVLGTRHALPAVGAEAEGRFRAGAAAWVFARVAALGVLLGEGYRVDGELVLDTSRLQLTASAGLGMSLW